MSANDLGAHGPMCAVTKHIIMKTPADLSQNEANPGLFEEQRRLAERHHAAAELAVEDYHLSLEHRHGILIEVRLAKGDGEWAGRVTFAWREDRTAEQHLIELEMSLPECIRPHILAHELTHLDLAGQAKDMGIFHCGMVTGNDCGVMLDCLKPESRALLCEKHGDSAEEMLEALNRKVVITLANLVQNVSLDMVVETLIKQRMPLLRPSQFVSACINIEQQLTATQFLLVQDHLRPSRSRALRALSGAYALFLDRMFDNTTDYFAQYRGTEHEEVARELVERFNAIFPQLQPGGEYDLVDSFADVLGLREMYTWIPGVGNKNTIPVI
jgi:hypothetical protein